MPVNGAMDTDRFVAACRSAALGHDPVAAVRRTLQGAVGTLAAGETTLAPLEPRYACRSGDALLGHDCTLFEDEAVTVVIVSLALSVPRQTE